MSADKSALSMAKEQEYSCGEEGDDSNYGPGNRAFADTSTR